MIKWVVGGVVVIAVAVYLRSKIFNRPDAEKAEIVEGLHKMFRERAADVD